jgi:hypothetical protein
MISFIRVVNMVGVVKAVEGDVSLTFVLTTGATIHHHLSTKLAPDVLEATSKLAEISEQIKEKKPHSFVEHQKIEDKLVTIMQQLQK